MWKGVHEPVHDYIIADTLNKKRQGDFINSIRVLADLMESDEARAVGNEGHTTSPRWSEEDFLFYFFPSAFV